MNVLLYQIYNNYFEMKPDTLKSRISQCVDDLGLLLDCIYKFSQKNRQNYFERIQNMKNKLLTLKNNIRESNSSVIEKQYKQLYLATNTLKSQIQHQQSMLPSKQNREINRSKDFKEFRKTHEDTMKLLVDKEEEIKQLRSILFEKDSLININEEELYKIKMDYEALLEQKRITQYNQSSLEIEIQRNKALAVRYQSDLMDFKIREEEKDKAFNNAIEELQRLKLQLIQANQKIISLQYTAQVHFQKALQAQTSSKKAQSTAKDRIDTCSIKQKDSLSRLRQIGQLELSLKTTTELLREQEQKNKHLQQDIQVFQSKVQELYRQKNQLKDQFEKEKQILIYQKQLIEKENSNSVYRENELKQLLEQAEKKYRIVIGKLNEAEQIRNTLTEVECQFSQLQNQKEVLMISLEKSENQIAMLTKDNTRLQQKLESSQTEIRESEVQSFRLKQKLRLKEDDIQELGQSLERFKDKIREYQKQLSSREKKERIFETSLHQEKQRIVMMQQKEKVKNKEVSTLKTRLLKAKIETIRQIRSSLTQ